MLAPGSSAMLSHRSDESCIAPDSVVLPQPSKHCLLVNDDQARQGVLAGAWAGAAGLWAGRLQSQQS